QARWRDRADQPHRRRIRLPPDLRTGVLARRAAAGLAAGIPVCAADRVGRAFTGPRTRRAAPDAAARAFLPDPVRQEPGGPGAGAREAVRRLTCRLACADFAHGTRFGRRLLTPLR